MHSIMNNETDDEREAFPPFQMFLFVHVGMTFNNTNGAVLCRYVGKCVHSFSIAHVKFYIVPRESIAEYVCELFYFTRISIMIAIWSN